jgi:hypothetical protein
MGTFIGLYDSASMPLLTCTLISSQSKPSESVPRTLSPEELIVLYMADVEAELLRWEQYDWAGNDTMGTLSLVEFWKVCMHSLQNAFT